MSLTASRYDAGTVIREGRLSPLNLRPSLARTSHRVSTADCERQPSVVIFANHAHNSLHSRGRYEH